MLKQSKPPVNVASGTLAFVVVALLRWVVNVVFVDNVFVVVFVVALVDEVWVVVEVEVGTCVLFRKVG